VTGSNPLHEPPNVVQHCERSERGAKQPSDVTATCGMCSVMRQRLAVPTLSRRVVAGTASVAGHEFPHSGNWWVYPTMYRGAVAGTQVSPGISAQQQPAGMSNHVLQSCGWLDDHGNSHGGNGQLYPTMQPLRHNPNTNKYNVSLLCTRVNMSCLEQLDVTILLRVPSAASFLCSGQIEWGCGREIWIQGPILSPRLMSVSSA
jgi:hypothetical protein